MVFSFISRKERLHSANQITKKVNQNFKINVNDQQVREACKRKLDMSYRQVKKIPIQANTQRCLVLRQQYALKMLVLLSQKKRIINVDESWLNESTFYRKLWFPKSEPGTIPIRGITPRVSMLAAIDTAGKSWFALA